MRRKEKCMVEVKRPASGSQGDWWMGSHTLERGLLLPCLWCSFESYHHHWNYCLTSITVAASQPMSYAIAVQHSSPLTTVPGSHVRAHLCSFSRWVNVQHVWPKYILEGTLQVKSGESLQDSFCAHAVIAGLHLQPNWLSNCLYVARWPFKFPIGTYCWSPSQNTTSLKSLL